MCIYVYSLLGYLLNLLEIFFSGSDICSNVLIMGQYLLVLEIQIVTKLSILIIFFGLNHLTNTCM